MRRPVCLWVCVFTSVCPTERPQVGLGGPGGMGTGSCSQERYLSLHQTLPESLTSLFVCLRTRAHVRAPARACTCLPAVCLLCVCVCVCVSTHTSASVYVLCTHLDGPRKSPSACAPTDLCTPAHVRVAVRLCVCAEHRWREFANVSRKGPQRKQLRLCSHVVSVTTARPCQAARERPRDGA